MNIFKIFKYIKALEDRVTALEAKPVTKQEIKDRICIDSVPKFQQSAAANAIKGDK